MRIMYYIQSRREDEERKKKKLAASIRLAFHRYTRMHRDTGDRNRGDARGQVWGKIEVLIPPLGKLLLLGTYVSARTYVVTG